MAKDIETCSDISPDAGDDVCSDSDSDCGGELASDNGIDLNAGKVSKADGLAKATMMSYEAPPPEDYSEITTRSPDSAIYTEAPEHAGKTPEQIAAEMAEAWGYIDPAPDNRGIEGQQPHKPEYSDSPR